jgi:hypothetical protein
MARKRETPAPLFSLKEPFKESLDNFCTQAIMLHSAIETALELEQINEKAAPIIKERLKAFFDAMSGE